MCSKARIELGKVERIEYFECFECIEVVRSECSHIDGCKRILNLTIPIIFRVNGSLTGTPNRRSRPAARNIGSDGLHLDT